MIRAFTDADTIAPWVSARIPGHPEWVNPKAVGWIDRDRIIAGVVYSHYSPGLNLEMSVALEGRFPPRAFVEAFIYPFIELGLPRVTALVGADNRRSIKLVEGMGFVHEGRLRRAAPGGQDLLVLGMLREECRFLMPKWVLALKRAVRKEMCDVDS